MNKKIIVFLLVVVMFIGCSFCRVPFDQSFKIDKIKYCEIPSVDTGSGVIENNTFIHKYDFPKEFQNLPMTLDTVEIVADIERQIENHPYDTNIELVVLNADKSKSDELIKTTIKKDEKNVTLKGTSEVFKNALNKHESCIYIKVKVDDIDFDIDQAIIDKGLIDKTKIKEYIESIESSLDMTVKLKGQIDIVDASVQLIDYLKDGYLTESEKEGD